MFATLTDLDETRVFTLNAPLVIMITSIVIPIIAGKVTKVSSRWTGPIMLALNAVAAALTSLVAENGQAVFSAQTLFTALVGAFSSQLAYRTLLAPNGITNNPAANREGVAKLGPDKGLG